MRTLTGTVVSSKMQKTAVVRVDRLKKHPRYGKYYRVSEKFKAHDEQGEYRAGDRVVLEETRPLSKEKRWKAVRLVRRPGAEEETDGEKNPEASSSFS